VLVPRLWHLVVAGQRSQPFEISGQRIAIRNSWMNEQYKEERIQEDANNERQHDVNQRHHKTQPTTDIFRKKIPFEQDSSPPPVTRTSPERSTRLLRMEVPGYRYQVQWERASPAICLRSPRANNFVLRLRSK
jgi:hypothetical protein